MTQKLIISKNNFTEDMYFRLWEAGSDGPTAYVYSTTLVEKNGSGVPTPGAGHQVDETIIANGLDKVVHIARLIGVTSGTIYFEKQNMEPITSIINIFDPIQFKVGDGGTNTPAANQDTCVTPELIGLDETKDFLINRNNYGILSSTTHFSFDSPSGTWILTNPDQFGDTEEFTIIRLPQVITTPVNDSVVGKWFSDFVDISSNTNYSNSHLRKLIRFSGSPQYTFQVSDTVPIGYAFCFQHFGSAGTAKINFNNGTLLWAGSPKASIDIPRYTEIAIVFDGTHWNVIYFTDSSFANAPSIPPGTILKVGTQAQGDIPAGDPAITITHNAGVAGDYLLWVTFRNNNAASYGPNNKICWSWHHHATDKPNKVVLTPQEVTSEVQNVTICYMLISV
jgi:hypothetical protein